MVGEIGEVIESRGAKLFVRACSEIWHAESAAPPANFRFTWYVRLLFWLQRRRYGRELEPARLWGRTPRAFLAMAAMYGALDRKSSPIDPDLRALILVRVSQINWCSFCIDINSATCLKRGVSEEKLAALPQFAESALFDEREKAALHYAEAMTDSNRHSDPALIARLRQHFSDDAIIELTALIAYQNMSSKFNAALGVPAQGFCAAA
ncbi:MAG: carboxymuconolactone decarboxylase family protein [Betaproteobacteria bacterium]|nr:carboxymuconolactone decarboxylase family protein [Betaproteobacteria bacterium]